MVYRTRNPVALNYAATKLQAAARGFVRKRQFGRSMTMKRTRDAMTRHAFWHGRPTVKGRSFALRKAFQKPVPKRDPFIGHNPPVFDRATRARIYRQRAAADYRYYKKTGKRRDIMRGGAFFN